MCRQTNISRMVFHVKSIITVPFFYAVMRKYDLSVDINDSEGVTPYVHAKRVHQEEIADILVNVGNASTWQDDFQYEAMFDNADRASGNRNSFDKENDSTNKCFERLCQQGQHKQLKTIEDNADDVVFCSRERHPGCLRKPRKFLRRCKEKLSMSLPFLPKLPRCGFENKTNRSVYECQLIPNSRTKSWPRLYQERPNSKALFRTTSTHWLPFDGPISQDNLSGDMETVFSEWAVQLSDAYRKPARKPTPPKPPTPSPEPEPDPEPTKKSSENLGAGLAAIKMMVRLKGKARNLAARRQSLVMDTNRQSLGGTNDFARRMNNVGLMEMTNDTIPERAETVENDNTAENQDSV